MQKVQLTEGIPDRPIHGEGASEQARIIAEIAERLLELKEIEATAPVKWLQRVALLMDRDRPATWLYLTLQKGDLSEITKSYKAAGEKEGKTKQAIQQEHERSLVTIESIFPSLSEAICQLRSITAQYKDEHETDPK